MIGIKICGITNLEDAILAQDSGAQALGFIFYNKSKRFVEPKMVKSITKKLNPFLIKVGVFVNESQENIKKTFNSCRLTHVQLHGDESVEFARTLQLPVIKAINYSAHIEQDVAAWANFDILIDSGSKEARGGTGKSLPWSELAQKVKLPFILAGGLNDLNVSEAIRKSNAVAVDVSSGVEKSYGLKDHKKLRQFILKAKSELN